MLETWPWDYLRELPYDVLLANQVMPGPVRPPLRLVMLGFRSTWSWNLPSRPSCPSLVILRLDLLDVSPHVLAADAQFPPSSPSSFPDRVHSGSSVVTATPVSPEPGDVTARRPHVVVIGVKEEPPRVRQGDGQEAGSEEDREARDGRRWVVGVDGSLKATSRDP